MKGVLGHEINMLTRKLIKHQSSNLKVYYPTVNNQKLEAELAILFASL